MDKLKYKCIHLFPKENLLTMNIYVQKDYSLKITPWLSLSMKKKRLSFALYTDCGIAPSIANSGKSTKKTTYGTTVYYSCDRGYSGIGSPDYRTCQSDGHWTSSSYFCERKGKKYIEEIFHSKYLILIFNIYFHKYCQVRAMLNILVSKYPILW